MVIAATKSMSATDTAAALAKTGLSKAEQIHILRLKGVKAEEAATMVETAKYAATNTSATIATKGLTTATSGLGSAIKGVGAVIKSNPYILIATAAILAVTGLKHWGEANKRAAEEAEELAQKTREDAKAVVEEEEKLNTLIEKYKELASSGKRDKETTDNIKQVQTDIKDLIGNQAKNLDLVNDKLSTSLNKLNDIKDTLEEDSYSKLSSAANASMEAAEKNLQHLAGGMNGINNWWKDSSWISFDVDDSFDDRKAMTKLIQDALKKSGKGSFGRDATPFLPVELLGGIFSGGQLEQTDWGADDYFYMNLDSQNIQDKKNALESAIKALEGTDYETSQMHTKLQGIYNSWFGTNGIYTQAINDLNTFIPKVISENLENSDINNSTSAESYKKQREELIQKIKENPTIKSAIEKGYYSDSQSQDDVAQLVGESLAELYPDMEKKFSIDDKLQQIQTIFSKRAFNESGKKEFQDFEEWKNSLSDEDKEILATIDIDETTAKWKLNDWKKALEDTKNESVNNVDDINNAFTQLMNQKGTSKDPSFVESIEKTVEKFQKLEDALVKFESGTLKDSEKMSLFKTFPKLTEYANNLGQGIKNLLGEMRSDVVKQFDEQIEDFKNKGATESEIAQLEAYKQTILSIADATNSVQNALSSMQTVFQDLDKIVKDYNENQYFSLESLEKLSTSSGQKYLQYLTYENGQLKVNEEAYKKLVLAQIDEIETKATLQATTDLQSLSDETTAKEYLAKVNIDLADSQLTAAQAAFQYALALKLSEGGNVAKAAQKVADNLNTLRNIFASAREQAKSYSGAMLGAATATNKKAKASEKAKDALEKEKTALEHSKEALEQEKKALEKNKSEYEKAKNAIQSLIEWTQKYIKQIKENEIKALEEQKKKFDEVIEKQKEQLQAEKDLHEYEKSLSEKQNTLASNALKSAVASLDDSAAGKKAYKKAQEEYKTSQTDLQDFLYEHEIDVRQESLDKLKEDTDKSYQDQIDTIQDFLNDEVKMYREACSMIDNDNGSLYGKLLDYCLNYTTTGRAEFDHMWTEAKSAMDKYNTANLSTIDLINDLQGRIYDVDSAIDTLTTNIETYENRISNLKNQIDDLKDAAIEAKNAIDAANSTPLNPAPTKGKTSFWVNYNGKKYETGSHYNGDTKGNRLLAANELTKLIAKDVSGFDNYGLSQIQAMLGVGTNSKVHGWYYQFDGKTYTSTSQSKDNAVKQIRQQLASKYGNSSFVLDQVYGKIQKYANGTRAAHGGLSIVDEEGLFSEFIPYQIGKGRYSFLPEGNPVFSKAMTNTMFDFASDPADFVNSIRNDSSKTNLSTNVVINIAGNADRETVKQLKRLENDIVDKANNKLMDTALSYKRLI